MVPGLRLCRTCRDRLANDLAALPDLYRHCESQLVNRRGWDVQRVRGGTPTGIALDDGLVAARSRMLTVLASWAGQVVRGRQLSAPPRRRITELSACLATHLSWLAAHPDARELAAQVAALVSDARQAIGPGHPTRSELGPCDHPDCGSTVYVTAGVAGTTPAQVACADGHVQQPHQWLLLARRWERPAHRGEAEDARREPVA